MPKKFYSQTPAVPEKQVAGTNPIQGPVIGTTPTSTAVPSRPGITRALGYHPKKSHGFGHAPKAKSGHYRLSGVPGAHRLGASGIRKAPPTNRG